MKRVFKLFFFLLVLNNSSCKLHQLNQVPSVTLLDSEQQQEEVYTLLLQGKRYSQLNKHQKQTECLKLKNDYQTQSHWHTAWFLVYALNNDFNCVTLEETLSLLDTIQTAPDKSKLLLWLNKYQIDLLTDLDKSQKELKKTNSKIQALKAIEANINKKLDNEQTNQQ